MAFFNPARLRLARRRRCLLRRELAELCGVTTQAVANWESGLRSPSEEAAAGIAAHTGFPIGFFGRPGIDPIPHGAVTFRARTRIPSRKKHAALAAGAMATELAGWIEARFDLPPVRLPDLSRHPQRPELVAQVIRQDWGLGDKPIPNMIHLLESRGVFVLSLAQDIKELDAFSFWFDDRPIVMLNTMKSAERGRTDAAHELFHLVCHRDITDKSDEADADRFAGAFLMPTGDVYKRIPRFNSLPQLIDVKQRWGVALSALVCRLHELRLLTDWQYRALFIQLCQLGYRSREPSPLPAREASTLLAQVFAALEKRGVRPPSIARELAWGREHLDELIFGLGAVLLPVNGKATAPTQGRRDHLTLVSGEWVDRKSST